MFNGDKSDAAEREFPSTGKPDPPSDPADPNDPYKENLDDS
jgi:hypothetical protein